MTDRARLLPLFPADLPANEITAHSSSCSWLHFFTVKSNNQGNPPNIFRSMCQQQAMSVAWVFVLEKKA